MKHDYREILKQFEDHFYTEISDNYEFQEMIFEGCVGYSYVRPVIMKFIAKYTDELWADFCEEYLSSESPLQDFAIKWELNISFMFYPFSKYLIYEIVILFLQKYLYHALWINEKHSNRRSKPDSPVTQKLYSPFEPVLTKYIDDPYYNEDDLPF